MRHFSCTCGGPLFFDNTLCTNCARAAGWCELCAAVVGFEPGDAVLTCPAGHTVYLCKNGVEHAVCNRYHGRADALCGACRLNRTVPDLSVDGHRVRWAKLEAAKRRMLYDLSRSGLRLDLENGPLPLRFDFKTNALQSHDGRWVVLAGGQKVFTGHDNGLITINVREADSVERERNRVALGERQRTLVGHFRHEVGHYVWDVLIKGDASRLASFTALFGDPYRPVYADALQAYYNNGPPGDWSGRFVSAYAAMHPWEDWAETWHAYLDLIGTLDTLGSFAWLDTPGVPDTCDAMIDAYAEAGIVLNELNRNRGLPPLIPEVYVDPVRAKVRYIHDLIASVAPAGVG